MHIRTIQLVAFAVAAGFAAPAMSQITYVSQARSVTSSRPITPPYSCSFTAPDFGPFSASCLYANQNSTLAPGVITWSGFAGYAGGSPPGTGSSDFDVTFSVATTVQFTWTASRGGMNAPVFNRLTGPGTDLSPPWDGSAHVLRLGALRRRFQR
jgi:hypothetical protein